MGARTSSSSGNKSSSSNDDKSSKKLPRPVVDSDVKAIAALILKLSKDVMTSKKIFNEIESSENIGEKIQELQNQSDQIQRDIDHILKEIRKLQDRIAHAGTTETGLLREFADLITALKHLDSENKDFMTKTKELQKRAQRLQTGVSQK